MLVLRFGERGQPHHVAVQRLGAVAALIPAHDDRTQALHGDMVRLAALTEAEHQHAASSQRAPTGPSAIPAPYDIRRASERMVTVKPSPDIARCTTRLASNRMP